MHVCMYTVVCADLLLACMNYSVCMYLHTWGVFCFLFNINLPSTFSLYPFFFGRWREGRRERGWLLCRVHSVHTCTYIHTLNHGGWGQLGHVKHVSAVTNARLGRRPLLARLSSARRMRGKAKALGVCWAAHNSHTYILYITLYIFGVYIIILYIFILSWVKSKQRALLLPLCTYSTTEWSLIITHFFMLMHGSLSGSAPLFCDILFFSLHSRTG